LRNCAKIKHWKEWIHICFIEIGNSKNTGCFCYNGSGNYCGTRKSCGYLNGTCDATTLYYCPGGNGLPATSKGQCPGYCMETFPGLDACPLRKQLFNFIRIQK